MDSERAKAIVEQGPLATRDALEALQQSLDSVDPGPVALQIVNLACAAVAAWSGAELRATLMGHRVAEQERQIESLMRDVEELVNAADPLPSPDEVRSAQAALDAAIRAVEALDSGDDRSAQIETLRTIRSRGFLPEPRTPAPFS